MCSSFCCWKKHSLSLHAQHSRRFFFCFPNRTLHQKRPLYNKEYRDNSFRFIFHVFVKFIMCSIRIWNLQFVAQFFCFLWMKNDRVISFGVLPKLELLAILLAYYGELDKGVGPIFMALRKHLWIRIRIYLFIECIS